CFFFLQCYSHSPYLHSFPTRRSSDLSSPFSMNRICEVFCDSMGSMVTFNHPRKKFSIESGTLASRGPGVFKERFDSFPAGSRKRSEEHTSELQSRFDLVCRLLLEKKK